MIPTPAVYPAVYSPARAGDPTIPQARLATLPLGYVEPAQALCALLAREMPFLSGPRVPTI